MNALTTADHEFLTVADVARLLQCSEPTVRRRIRAGELPAVKLGRGRSVLRVPRAALEAWLTTSTPSTVTSTSSSAAGERGALR
jgi:excisionase family DNA binding protein